MIFLSGILSKVIDVMYYLVWVDLDTGDEGGGEDKEQYNNRVVAEKCATFCNTMMAGNRRFWWVVPLEEPELSDVEL